MASVNGEDWQVHPIAVKLWDQPGTQRARISVRHRLALRSSGFPRPFGRVDPAATDEKRSKQTSMLNHASFSGTVEPRGPAFLRLDRDIATPSSAWRVREISKRGPQRYHVEPGRTGAEKSANLPLTALESRPTAPRLDRANEKISQELERVKGIEPSYSAWKAAALPLSYTRAAAILCQSARRLAMGPPTDAFPI